MGTSLYPCTSLTDCQVPLVEILQLGGTFLLPLLPWNLFQIGGHREGPAWGQRLLVQLNTHIPVRTYPPYTHKHTHSPGTSRGLSAILLPFLKGFESVESKGSRLCQGSGIFCREHSRRWCEMAPCHPQNPRTCLFLASKGPLRGNAAQVLGPSPSVVA